jgi:hypothetical protein
MNRISLAVVLALSASASADPTNAVTLTGADARALTHGLKLAGIPVKDHGYVVTKVSCTTTDGSVLEDGLESTSCQTATGKAMSAAQSALLGNAITTALSSKGLPSDDHMSKTTITVGSIDCRIAADDKAAKTVDRFTCDVGLRESLVFTPKKVKIKDIVQPVKIEKQEKMD